MVDPELSLDELNGGFLGVEYLILDVDYAMVLNVEHDRQPDDTPVSLILGPEQEESRLINACLAEHREELSICRLECPRCGCLGTNRRKPICKNCHSPLKAIRDTSEEWLRGEAWEKVRWEVPGFQARSIVPKWLVGKLYPGNAATPPDLVLPLSMVFQRLLELMRDTRSRYVRECWKHLYLGESVCDTLPRGETVEEKHRHYLVVREKLIAGYNWLTGTARQYPEFMEDYEQHKGIRRFPPAVMLEASEPRPTQVADVDAGDSTPKEKGVTPRNDWLLQQYEAKGTDTYHKPAEIHAKWEAMTTEERAQICPDSPNKITKDTVVKGIKRAQAARDGKGKGKLTGSKQNRH